jgi:hypothetical protein
MATFKKKDLNELVGGDINSSGGDKNAVSNSEIETGPVANQWGDDSYYEKGQSTTTDKVFARYRQDIPWFAVYSFGSSRFGRGMTTESTKKVITKKTMEERIEDLVKKTKTSDVTEKNYNPKVAKLIDTINDNDLTEKQIEDLIAAIQAKKNNSNKTKNI